MIKSMTGYGRATVAYPDKQITVELRSVNNRFLDCSVKLPRIYTFAEEAIKARVKQEITRGKVDVFVTVSLTQSSDVKISLNRPVLEGYLTAMHTMTADYEIRDDISVTALGRLPDVFTVEKAEQDEKEITLQLLQTTGQALDSFHAMRCAEGEAISRDLRDKAAGLLRHVETVETRSPETVAEYRARLENKMKELLASTSIEETRILTEAAIYADKIAVDEETVRLRSHLSQLDTMLLADQPVGRKLDFLLQEMNRETNTIGSKCSDLQLSQVVVEMKAELEKIREQIQNIE